MSLRKVIKLLGKVGDAAREASNVDSEFYKQVTMELGEEIRDRLLDGLVRGYDVNGNRFHNLKDSTINVRRHPDVSISGKSPLRANGGIENFLQSKNLFTSGKLQVKLNNPPKEYMIYQNEGFTPTFIPWIPERGKRKGELTFIPNKKGISVPARKWFGIPKTYQEGGTKYNKFLNRVAGMIDKKIGSAIKGG